MKIRPFIPLLVLLLFVFSCADASEDTIIEVPKEDPQGTNDDNPPDDNTQGDGSQNNDGEKTCIITNKDGLLIIEGESFNLKGKLSLIHI